MEVHKIFIHMLTGQDEIEVMCGVVIMIWSKEVRSVIISYHQKLPTVTDGEVFRTSTGNNATDHDYMGQVRISYRISRTVRIIDILEFCFRIESL